MLVAHQAKGAGYAISKPEELQTVIDVAQTTGDFIAALLRPPQILFRMRIHHNCSEGVLLGLLVPQQA